MSHDSQSESNRSRTTIPTPSVRFGSNPSWPTRFPNGSRPTDIPVVATETPIVAVPGTRCPRKWARDLMHFSYGGPPFASIPLRRNRRTFGVSSGQFRIRNGSSLSVQVKTTTRWTVIGNGGGAPRSPQGAFPPSSPKEQTWVGWAGGS